jgi:hypothetical protein
MTTRVKDVMPRTPYTRSIPARISGKPALFAYR